MPLHLSTTTSAPPKSIRVCQIIPINVASDGVSCTLNTRYEDMAATDILTIAHFPKTVVLIEHFL